MFIFNLEFEGATNKAVFMRYLDSFHLTSTVNRFTEDILENSQTNALAEKQLCIHSAKLLDVF